jgi:hypothetical protein
MLQTPANQPAAKNPKKRPRDEPAPARGDEQSEIDAILASLKQRVLQGETLNQFKKETV